MERPIAHRGLFIPGLSPENSLAAFRAALDFGFGMECDVRLSGDGLVCVFHDETLERLSDGVGVVSEVPFGQLRANRLQGTSEGIPLLQDLLALVAGRCPLVIELKSFDAGGWHVDGALEEAVVKALSGYRGPVVLKSFNPHSVGCLIDLQAAWPVGQISCRMEADGDFAFLSTTEAQALAALETDAARRAHFISYGIGDLDDGLRFRSEHAAKPWMSWTIRTPGQLAKAAQMRCQFVFERTVLQEVLEQSQK
jgi:glycerophosphoryl diester phosphodiesterase